MRVLHLPANIASQASITVGALRDIGVDARGIVRNNIPIQGDRFIRNYNVISVRRHGRRGIVPTLAWWVAVQAAVRWADVVHWHSTYHIWPGNLDLKYVRWLGKARLVEFFGSDIRNPDIATQDNPYLARLLADPASGYRLSGESSRRTQQKFARHGFAAVIPGPELLTYVQPDLYPRPYRSEVALNLADFDPAYPDPGKQRPLVVHVPSNQAIKGTSYVLQAVEKLRPWHDFEFRLIHNVPHTQAMSLVRECDIMLDQFIIGSFGTAALEAMAFGKPALSYIKPSLMRQLPADFPIVNANPDNLAEVLSGLLADGRQRRALGQLARNYVEQRHDAHKIAHQLAGIYRELLANQRRGGHERR